MKKLALIVIILALGLNACSKTQKVTAPEQAPAATEQSAMPATGEQTPAAEQEGAPAAVEEQEVAPAAGTAQ